MAVSAATSVGGYWVKNTDTDRWHKEQTMAINARPGNCPFCGCDMRVISVGHRRRIECTGMAIVYACGNSAFGDWLWGKVVG